MVASNGAQKEDAPSGRTSGTESTGRISGGSKMTMSRLMDKGPQEKLISVNSMVYTPGFRNSTPTLIRAEQIAAGYGPVLPDIPGNGPVGVQYIDTSGRVAAHDFDDVARQVRKGIFLPGAQIDRTGHGKVRCRWGGDLDRFNRGRRGIARIGGHDPHSRKRSYNFRW